MTKRKRPISGIWTGCAVGAALWVLIVALLVALLGLPSEAEGQARASIFEPAALDGAKTWCWQNDPWCSPVAHGSVTVGFSAVMDLTGIMDGDDARWIPLGFYALKEIHDYHRAGDRIPAYDYALDFGGAALGWWISGLLFGEDDSTRGET